MTAVGTALPTLRLRQTNSHDSATSYDLRQCARCGEQNQYCHSHTPVIPNPTLDLPPQIPVWAPVPADGVARFNLSHVQATALAGCLIDALEQNGQNTIEFCQSMTTGSSLLTSLQRVLESPPPSLLKGWVYKVEDVSVKTEAEVVNPNDYLMLDAPLTHLKHKQRLDDQYANPYRQHRRASNTTEALPSSLSVSKRTAAKRQLGTSKPTLMHLTPL
jgi:hypothetical protein